MKTMLIAEIGVNHNAQVDLACKMIEAAKKNGANVVKFQTHIPDKEMIHNVEQHVPILSNLYQLIEDVTFDFEQMQHLKKFADLTDIRFLSTPFSIEAVDELEELEVDAYKVGSGETDNFMLLNRICETKKPIYISTGLSHWAEIVETVDFLRSRDADFTLMQCTSAYPCPVDSLHLNVLQKYKKEFACDVGLSDHSGSIYPALAAVALGATAVEKHFTLSRNLPGNDQFMSMEPREFGQMAQAIDIVEQSLGSDNKDTFALNEDLRTVFRHGLVTKKPISVGDTFSLDNITVKRPLAGIPAKSYMDVIGKKCVVELEQDTPILNDHVAP